MNPHAPVTYTEGYGYHYDITPLLKEYTLKDLFLALDSTCIGTLLSSIDLSLIRAQSELAGQTEAYIKGIF